MKRINPYLQCTLGRNNRWLLVVLVVLFLSGCIQQGVYHLMKPGQTLYRISKTYKVNEAYLARINGISDPSQLRVGTRIYIPGAARVKYVPATVPQKIGISASTPKSKTRVAELPAKTKRVPSLAKVAPRRKIAPVKNVIPASKVATKTRKSKGKLGLKLRWPLRGKILRAFGIGGKNGGKGLEIAAPMGSTVSAAAAGKVIYSGNGVQGYGHLMILQHENDVFTVYGFNSKNFVKQGQFVSQGERIASSGRPPSGESGRLHFEVRVGKQAIDPILYLP